MIEEVEKRDGDAASYVKELLDNGERLMGFGHRVYRAEDPRARVLRRTAKELDAPRYEVAEALEQAALAELRERRPDRVLETNVEFWAAIVLDFAEVPPHMFTSMFTCARTGGWSAHILEQKTTGRLIRPSAIYAGPTTRPANEVDGWDAAWAPERWISRDVLVGATAVDLPERPGTGASGGADQRSGSAQDGVPPGSFSRFAATQWYALRARGSTGREVMTRDTARQGSGPVARIAAKARWP